jgi:hypothetical protein
VTLVVGLTLIGIAERFSCPPLVSALDNDGFTLKNEEDEEKEDDDGGDDDDDGVEIILFRSAALVVLQPYPQKETFFGESLILVDDGHRQALRCERLDDNFDQRIEFRPANRISTSE